LEENLTDRSIGLAKDRLFYLTNCKVRLLSICCV